jgi:tetratricopeptide (TPR) repeat protein
MPYNSNTSFRGRRKGHRNMKTTVSSQGMGGQMAPPPNQQSQTQGQQGQAKPATPAPAAPTTSPAEEAAWKKLSTTTSTDASEVAKDGEDFLKKFNSDPAKPSIYADKVYGQLAAAYMQLNEPDKMFAALRKALDINPDNIEALAIMSMAGSRRIDPKAPNAPDKEKATEAMARRGIELLNALQKPDSMTDAVFTTSRDEQLAMCHSGLGRVDQLEGKPVEAAQEFAMAVKLETPPDAVDEFLLGVSLSDSKQFGAAVSAFTDCLKDPGPMKEMCTNALSEAKKAAASAPKQ